MYDVLKKYWGYDSFLPLQKETIDSMLAGQESLTVLPTGGGKSLCYQLPALMVEGMAVVISPLISLMKDQVDTLRGMGIDAVCLHSGLKPQEQFAIMDEIRAGDVKLLYVAPERINHPGTLSLLHEVDLSFLIIDEAHCISHWGHDFRPDYRRLKDLRDVFPLVTFHAFTATATPEVERDICSELTLLRPKIMIGSVDRKNLTYRVQLRGTLLKQVKELLAKHSHEAGIIYCLRRKDVEKLSKSLADAGIPNVKYHAGLSDVRRHKNQEKFMRGSVDIVVATIAFGMGIDRSDIRFVIHAGMPKSIEHYQQETGRAGRDGLPAHCYLLYGGGDYGLWSHFAAQSENRDIMVQKLSGMYSFCSQPQCRHRVLSEYFGQEYTASSCEACDVCLQEVEMVDNPLIVAQKILSCVVRVWQKSGYGFGADHIASILRGLANEKVVQRGHDDLSTFAIMEDVSNSFIRFMIEQLIGQSFLERTGPYNVLSLTDEGVRVLRGEVVPVLAKPLEARKKKEVSKARKKRRELEWEGVDEDLFMRLKTQRSLLAAKKGVPPYVVFSDKSLIDMACRKPTDRAAFATIFGVGEAKLKKYAKSFLQIINQS